MSYNKKYKIILKQGDTLDSNYKRMVEILMKISNMDESEIVGRKDSWIEEVVELDTYEITLDLTEREYNEIRKNFRMEKVEIL